MKILLLEPDAELAKTIAAFLSKKHHEVVTVASAQAAIHQADELKPDAVILELAIPEHNGIEFLQEFKSYSDWLDVPIFVYSRIPLADSNLTDQQWQKYGVNTYFYKPTTTLENLERAVSLL